MGVLKRYIARLIVLISIIQTNGLVYGQQVISIDTAKNIIIAPPSYEPHYVLIQRAREQGMKKALQDDSLGQLVLHQYYRPPDPVKSRVTRIVVWNMYRMKFVPLTGSVSTQIMGYRYQAMQIMKQRYGDDYWDKVEAEVSVMLTTKCE